MFVFLYFLPLTVFANVVKIEVTRILASQDSFEVQILKQHNLFRERHFAPDLSWNASLYDYAALFVATYDCSGTLRHSGGAYGENIAIGYTPTGAVSAWYDEGKDYVYGSDATYNHFTAVVWNATTQLGCAYKYCGKVWGRYIVCSYFPAGNVVGQSSDNVLPPSPTSSTKSD